MVNKKLTFVFLALGAALAFAQVACGGDDASNNNPDTGVGDGSTVDTGADGGDAGACKFNDFVTGLIMNSTTATALPSTDLGDKCTDDQTPFPASIF